MIVCSVWAVLLDEVVVQTGARVWFEDVIGDLALAEFVIEFWSDVCAGVLFGVVFGVWTGMLVGIVFDLGPGV